MPRYDYRCPSCSVSFEVQRSFGDTTQVLCPECSAPARKVFAPAAVVFKGSGFHNTDYRPQPSETPAAAPAAPAAPACPASDSGGACASCPAHS